MEERDYIAEALTRVHREASLSSAQIVNSEQISRQDRELLTATGWLQEIIRGWYMLVRPDVATGDTAAWYASFWDFVRIYLKHLYGEQYCLSAEASLDIHSASTTTPKQVIVIVQKGGGMQKLMYETSLLTYVDNKNFPQEIEVKQGLNIMSLPYALCKVSPSYFSSNHCDAELALRAIDAPDSLSRVIIKYNLKSAAARLIGAFEYLHDKRTADIIKSDLLLKGIIVNPTNPFTRSEPLLMNIRVKSPYAGRIYAMWAALRETVIELFPPPPGLSSNPDQYLQRVSDLYIFDAYNSLSIEGYQVNPELISRVQNRLWNPDQNTEDANTRNALAAKGYWIVFSDVKEKIEAILHGAAAATIIKNNLQLWYQKLFSPGVQAKIIQANDLLGYRNDRVHIRNSRHSPPPKEAVLDAMEAFFNCLQNETHAGVKAVLGHYIFVFIHPYMDGNGRLGRFIMNTCLAEGGYPWTVVRVKNRRDYINCLEKAHTSSGIGDFVKFIAKEMQETPDQPPGHL